MRLVLGFACLVATGCMAAFIPETREVKLARATNDFAFELLKSFKNEKNVFISPFSISTALALVYLGADGTTSQAMRKTLKYDKYGLSDEDVHSAYRSVLNKVKQNSEDYELSSYNGALVQKDFIILHMYGHAIQEYYSAHIESVDFANEGEQIKAKINADVEQATHGKIKDLLEGPLSSDTKLFLLNAVYFFGKWDKAFNPNATHEGVFYNNGVTEKNVQMMTHTEPYQISRSKDLQATVLVLPYKGEDSARMVIALPNKKTGVTELQEKITEESLNNALKTSYEVKVDLRIPKFSLKYTAKLENVLERLGLGELFSNSANLNRMAGEQGNLKVSSVIHKAVIDVDERGSEAAAATGIKIQTKPSVPIVVSLNVNHPFLFFIVDNRSGLVLFSGRVDEI